MATVQEIEERDRMLRASEAKALHNLATHLRAAVIDLPAESQLARAFVRRARTFEEAAGHWDIPLHGGGELWMLQRDLDIDDAGNLREDFG